MRFFNYRSVRTPRGPQNIRPGHLVTLVVLLVPAAVTLFSEGATAEPSRIGIDWAAFGDLRGDIEPCGCDPRTDKGGILRIGNHLEDRRKNTPGLLLFNLGNNFGEFDQGKDKIANRFIAAGIERLHPTASLVNRRELAAIGRLKPQGNYLLSNADFKIGTAVLDRVKHARAIVFGYLWFEGASKNGLKRFGAELVRNWKKTLGSAKTPRGDKSPLRILLFSGPDTDLLAASKSGLFDLIIASNGMSLDSPVDGVEAENPGRLLRLDKPMEVYQAPVGGQGILLGGSLRKAKEPIPIGGLLRSCAQSPLGNSLGGTNQCDPKPISSPVVAIKGESIVSWLGPKEGGEGPLTTLMEDYQKEVARNHKRSMQGRLADLKASPFAGVSTCKTCHVKEWMIWQGSRHATSFPTLEKKNRHLDPSCVACHVLGLEEKGGFVSKKDSPDFASVQCENCHGAAKAHSQRPGKVKPKRPSKATCVQCHHSPHTTEFDYEKYWSKIRH